MIIEKAIWIALAYGLGLLLANRAAQSVRVEIFALAEELRKDKRSSGLDKEHLDHLMDTYISFRVSFLIPLAMLVCAFNDAFGKKIKRPRRWFSNDQRYHSLIKNYFWSIAACNPFMLILVVPPVAILWFAAKFARNGIFKKELEQSIVRAADLMEIPASA